MESSKTGFFPGTLVPILASILGKSQGVLRKTQVFLVQFSSVQSLSRVRLFATSWIAARQASLSITNSWSLFKLMSIELVMPPTISSSVVPFYSWLQSFPASGSFQMSQLFASGGQSISVSASTSAEWLMLSNCGVGEDSWESLGLQGDPTSPS